MDQSDQRMINTNVEATANLLAARHGLSDEDLLHMAGVIKKLANYAYGLGLSRAINGLESLVQEEERG